MQVELSERSMELARRAVERGLSPSVERAVESALESFMVDAESGRSDPDSEWSRGMRQRLAEADADIAEGRVNRADPAFWLTLRDRLATELAERGLRA